MPSVFESVRILVLVSTGLFSSQVLAQPNPGNYSAAEFGIIEELDRSASMRDGVALKVDVIRPASDQKFPAILQQTPYNKAGGLARARKFAQRGYVVVNVDARGRFESGGDWDPFSPLHKSDGYDLVEWAAHQPWCSGRVGTYGLSYMGWKTWWTATEAPPSLKAIVPEVAPPDHLFNCPYQNGVLVCWMVDWAGTMSGRTPHSAGPGPYGGFAVEREQAYRKLPYIDFDKSRHYLPNAWWRNWMTQNTLADPYWRDIAYQTPASYAKVQVPSLAITGWFDANFPGSVMNYQGAKEHGATPLARQPRLVIGPWEHIVNSKREAAGVDFGEQAIIDWDGYVCRWFDCHLKGIDNAVMNDHPVHVFVMGRNQWRSATDWPLPQTQFTKFFLHSGGQANSTKGNGRLTIQPPIEEPADRFTYDPDDPTPSAAFANGHIDGPRDISSAAARDDVLVYDTEPLDQDVELVGPITAKLYAATSARDTDWMVRLADVFPEGRALFLAEGIMRARHRDPDRDGVFNALRLSTIDPDKAYLYTIDFWRPTGNVFAKGHRIRIEISSSYYPYYLRNLNTGEDNIALATKPIVARQTILHDRQHPSHLVLPVIPQALTEKASRAARSDDQTGAERPKFAASVHADFGADRGQSLGSLLEIKDRSGKVIAGAGFLDVYNTRFRSDRHTVQFFVRQSSHELAFKTERLPHPDLGCGVYLLDFDQHVWAWSDVNGSELRQWSPESQSWLATMPKRTNRLRSGDGVMRVGSGTLVFENNTARFDERRILSPPDRGDYTHFYYGLGQFCFYHTDRSENGGFTKIHSCPWSAQNPEPAVDMRQAITLDASIVGETPFAWGQFRDSVLTVSNYGGVYACDGRRWKTVRPPMRGVSFQVYSIMQYYDTLLLAQYPSGCVYEYDGERLELKKDWPPVVSGVATSAREAQTMAIYGGDLLVGVWPWAELWRRDHSADRWVSHGRMFTHPELTAARQHPYEPEAVKHNLVLNHWGQRITGMVPVGDSLFLSTSAKGTTPWKESFDFLTDEKRREYGAVLKLTSTGNLSAKIEWKDRPTKFTFRVYSNRIEIHQDDRKIGESELRDFQLPDFDQAQTSLGQGIYGPSSGVLRNAP